MSHRTDSQAALPDEAHYKTIVINRQGRLMNELNRRKVTLNTLDDIVAEVERLAASDVTTTGKHSFPKIVRHLALTNNMMTGRIPAPKPPLIMKLLLPFIRSSILKGPVKPGVKLPANAEAEFWSDEEITVEDAVQMLKESVLYYKEHGPLPVHPIFGKATREQLDRLTCSHAEMHLSFVHPA
jgi:hypothetical protein